MGSRVENIKRLESDILQSTVRTEVNCLNWGNSPAKKSVLGVTKRNNNNLNTTLLNVKKKGSEVLNMMCFYYHDGLENSCNVELPAIGVLKSITIELFTFLDTEALDYDRFKHKEIIKVSYPRSSTLQYTEGNPWTLKKDVKKN